MTFLVAGVDEAGRGPLAGPVVVACVILDQSKPIIGLDDSKKLSSKKREKLYYEIMEKAIDYTIIEVSHLEIDKVNILQATLKGMSKAVLLLKVKPDKCLIDGNRVPDDLIGMANAVVSGDSLHKCISAASILAKVYRDRLMVKLSLRYPRYGFEKHKGYPTKQHLLALQNYGVLPIHRRSFKPVKKNLKKI